MSRFAHRDNARITEISKGLKGVSSPRDEQVLYIIGSNYFQNALLRNYLKDRIDLPCRIETGVNWASTQITPSCDALLILYDCFGRTPADILIKFGINGGMDPSLLPIALFNAAVDTDGDFEKKAIEKQFRGVFYSNEPLECLPKGIDKMIQGELWYSRKITSALLLERQRHRAKVEVAQAMLTPREKEILVAIASGAGNGDIANELYISLHTVKSHIYNIYKKIGVHNRLEASLWVARYLY